MRLGEILRAVRLREGKGLKEVAGKANLSIPQLSKLELGDRGLDVEDYVRICRALDCQPGDLLPNSAGLYSEFTPLLERLRTVPQQSRATVSDVLISILRLRATLCRSGTLLEGQDSVLPVECNRWEGHDGAHAYEWGPSVYGQTPVVTNIG